MDPPVAPEFSQLKTKKIPTTQSSDSKSFCILVIDTPDKNWFSIFRKLKIPNITVQQGEWKDLACTVKNGQLYVDMFPSAHPIAFSNQNKHRRVQPNLVIIRNVVTGPKVSRNFKNVLYGFLYANIPCINSAESISLLSERAIMFSKLLQLRHQNPQLFSLVPQDYFSDYDMLHDSPPEFPCVLKVGSAHAGYSKAAFRGNTAQESYDDFLSLVGVLDMYSTREQFVPNKGDVRIQRIANYEYLRGDTNAPQATYRIFRKRGTGWKGNRNATGFLDPKSDPHLEKLADKCATVCGGLDILALDLVEHEDGSMTILELNDTACGLGPGHIKLEDQTFIACLAIVRLEQHYEVSLFPDSFTLPKYEPIKVASTEFAVDSEESS